MLLPRASRAVYAHVGVRVFTATLLYLVAYQVLELRWVMLLASANAAFSAIAEWQSARVTHRQYHFLSCYASAIVLAVSAIALPFFNNLDASGITLSLATFVGLSGASEFLLGARMLFLEYRSEHPAPVASQAWRAEMGRPLMQVTFTPLAVQTFGSCSDCPADSQCSDFTVSGHVARVIPPLSAPPGSIASRTPEAGPATLRQTLPTH